MQELTGRRILKGFLTLASMVIWTFAGGFLWLIAAFSGDGYYVITVIASYFFVLIMIPVMVYRKARRKVIARLWLGWVAAFSLTIVVRESIRAYHESFEKLDAYNVDLDVYKPFRDGTLAVSLDEPSTLTLTDSLPRMDGATSFYPVYAAFARAVYAPDDQVEGRVAVRCSTTDMAYENLIYGDADIIFVFGPSREQTELAEHCEVEMVFTPIGREAFVFFVNSRNPVDGLSRQQLRDIYSGRVKKWDKLGGDRTKIRAFQRDRGSGSQTALIDFMEGEKLRRAPRRDQVYGMGPMVRWAADYANYPGAIGFSFRYFLNNMMESQNVKQLAIDGIMPTFETISDGSYPLTYDFYAVTRADRTNPNIDRLLEWILSPQGMEIIEKTGYNAAVERGDVR